MLHPPNAEKAVRVRSFIPPSIAQGRNAFGFSETIFEFSIPLRIEKIPYGAVRVK